jgi:hypothetical protein
MVRKEPRRGLAWRLKKKRQKSVESQESKRRAVGIEDVNSMGDAGEGMSVRRLCERSLAEVYSTVLRIYNLD